MDPCTVYINTSSASPARRNVSKYLSGAGEVFIYIYTYLIPLRHRRSLGSIYIHLSGTGEVFLHTSPGPKKCLYTKCFIHFSGVGEVFIYTPLYTWPACSFIISEHQCDASSRLPT